MTYDPARGVVVMYGGQAPAMSSVYDEDTWEYDGTDWTRVTSPTTPLGARFGGMTFDPRRNAVVWFGGNAPGNDSDGLWLYDGTTWALEPSAKTPPTRNGAAVEFHAQEESLVVFGGYRPEIGGVVNDTWEL